MTTLFLCFGSRTECWNCGGYTKAEDPGTGTEGPFAGDARFCSEECFVEGREHAERNSRAVSRVTGCRACGLDNFEHEPGCGGAPVKETP